MTGVERAGRRRRHVAQVGYAAADGGVRYSALLLMELLPNTAFGRYTIERELGRGGMGRVILAKDRVLERYVALKILLPGLLSKEEVVARFFREARLAAQLTHPNTVHVYDLGEVDGAPFIAMEFVDGKPLTAYLGDDHVPPERRMRWLVDVARGLGAAHARGLLHRDMKPANVMVGKDGVAKVVDFGLAKREIPSAEVRSTFQTATGFVIGTPAYMAPEQLGGEEDIDARADQFGWALTAYALMLGKNPRKDDPLLFGPIPLLSDRIPGLSRRAAEIVLRALSNDRAMRFPSMDALVSELESALARGLSIAPMKVSPAPPVVELAVDHPSTPRMASAPPRPFCSDCGIPFKMSSPGCPEPHVEAFPMPEGVDGA